MVIAVEKRWWRASFPKVFAQLKDVEITSKTKAILTDGVWIPWPWKRGKLQSSVSKQRVFGSIFWQFEIFVTLDSYIRSGRPI